MKYFLFLLILVAGCNRSTQEQEPLVAIQIQDRNGMTETFTNSERIQVYEGVDFLSSQPYKKVLRVYRGEGKNHSKITTYHPNGSIWQYLEAREMRARGAYREWYPNGQMKIDAQVIGGTADISLGSQKDWLFDGLSQVWDEQGRIVAKIPYRGGDLEGHSFYFYPSGAVEKDMNYEQNLLHGDSFEFYEDGKLKSQTQYHKGLKEGLSRGFFENGREAWVEDYAEGLLRKGSYHDPNGKLVSEVENGGGYQAHFENGYLSLLIEHRCGKPDGLMKKFTPSGDLIRQYRMKNGKKQGEEIEFYLSSELEDPSKHQKKLSILWNENLVHGAVKTWYNNGQLQSEREYCRNQKMGPALAWYRDGSIMNIEEYDNDQLVKGQYYKMGQRESVSTVVNGNGIATLYDEWGIFLHKIPYIKGKPVDPED